ncbi:B12-binding domain-containing protein [Elioraea sp.]|uniref:cobalamin B12-binding domain-containing protein n=1 Tax=Elioraea sp. TaxID=2185103 RepID=UPI0025B8F96C|nr:cobalamin B12-binding domain-containing protein [Elioraea sp.]
MTHRRVHVPTDYADAADCVVLLAELALASDVNGGASLMRQLQADGHTLENLYLDLVSGAVRYLGQLWHNDQISFADVTIGVLALRRLLHEFDRAFCGDGARLDPARQMLLMPRPGDPHSFAVDLVSAFLRRAGWNVTCLTSAIEGDVVQCLGTHWYAVLGISESCSARINTLGSFIRAARRASQNRRIRVIVGGAPFAADPDLAIRVGADACASDARHAATQVEGLFMMARREG